MGHSTSSGRGEIKQTELRQAPARQETNRTPARRTPKFNGPQEFRDAIPTVLDGMEIGGRKRLTVTNGGGGVSIRRTGEDSFDVTRVQQFDSFRGLTGNVTTETMTRDQAGRAIRRELGRNEMSDVRLADEPLYKRRRR